MFLENKYTKWYFAIISRRQILRFDGYTETHHIIPRSLGGNDKSKNLAKLTAREHFVCHKLLVKMLVKKSHGHQKMSFALHKMAYGTNATKYAISSFDYESVRKLNKEAIRDVQIERFKNPKTLQKQREYAANASKIAAECNRGNDEFKETCSKGVQKRVQNGSHNFLGGEIQRKMWEDSEFRELQEKNIKERVESGTHIFQDHQFIEKNREKLKNHWARMTPEERVVRGRKISEGRRLAKEHRKFLKHEDKK